MHLISHILVGKAFQFPTPQPARHYCYCDARLYILLDCTLPRVEDWVLVDFISYESTTEVCIGTVCFLSQIPLFSLLIK